MTKNPLTTHAVFAVVFSDDSDTSFEMVASRTSKDFACGEIVSAMFFHSYYLFPSLWLSLDYILIIPRIKRFVNTFFEKNKKFFRKEWARVVEALAQNQRIRGKEFPISCYLRADSHRTLSASLTLHTYYSTFRAVCQGFFQKKLKKIFGFHSA